MRRTRRDFLRLSAAWAAGTAAAPSIIPCSAFGAAGKTAPSDRVAVGLIGMGKMMWSHLRGCLSSEEVQVVALCDVERNRLKVCSDLVKEAYSQRFGADYKGVAVYRDFRELLARPDIDAVMIATPTNWHAIQAVEAMKAGKDVYCEKPLALTIREAQAIAEAARRYGRIFQVGSQQRSDYNFRFACELVRNGAIGKLKRVHVNVGGPAVECYLPAQPVPESLDWDLWLGPAPLRPYHAELAPQDNYAVFPHWRNYRDYCNGGLYDFGAHHFDIAQWGLGMDGNGPVEILPPEHSDFKRLTFLYADGTPMTHGGASGNAAVEFVGESGTVRVNRGFLETDPPELLRHKWGAGDLRLYESLDHKANWLDGIRTRQPCICTADIGLSTIAVCSLASIAYRMNEPLKWNPKAMDFVGNPAAGRLLSRSLRAPWTLTV
jgi:predicted dehydrogenase